MTQDDKLFGALMASSNEARKAGREALSDALFKACLEASAFVSPEMRMTVLGACSKDEIAAALRRIASDLEDDG